MYIWRKAPICQDLHSIKSYSENFLLFRNKHEHAGAAERSPGGQQPDVPPARGNKDDKDGVGEPLFSAGPAAAAAHDGLTARQHVAHVRGGQRRRLRLRQVVHGIPDGMHAVWFV